jgi:hypothetical protein
VTGTAFPKSPTRLVTRVFAPLFASVQALFPAPKTVEFPVLLDDSKQEQWVAFMRRSKLGEEGLTLKQVVEFLAEFLQPPLAALRAGDSFDLTWPPGGPWQESIG